MNTLSETTALLTNSLAWALIHSVWQGIIIFTVLFIVLKALPNLNARIKYCLSYGALSAMMLWFADTWLSLYQNMKGAMVQISYNNVSAGTTTIYHVRTISPTGQNVIPGNVLHVLEHWLPVIMGAYTLGLVVMLSHFFINVLQAGGLKRRGLIPLAPKYQDMLANCIEYLDISRPVQLYLSNRVSVPMMLGAIKPIILLPLTTINHLTTEQVEAILLHELAHIKRHDYLLNIFQTIAETVLFFNPFVWLISSIIRKEREHCCDDLVIAYANNPLPYAKALAILENNRINNNSLAVAATGTKKHLLNRIKRIMEMKNNSNINQGRLTIIVIAIITIVLSMATFSFTPSFAQKSKKVTKTKSDTVRQSEYHYKSVTIDDKGHKTVIEKVSSTPIPEMEDETNAAITSVNCKPATTVTIAVPFKRTMHDEDTNETIEETTDAAGNKNVIRKKIIISSDIDSKMEKMGSELEKEIERLGASMEEMGKELGNEIAKATLNATKNIKWEEIGKDIDKAMKDVDVKIKSSQTFQNKTQVSREKAQKKAETAREKAEEEREKAEQMREEAEEARERNEEAKENIYEKHQRKEEKEEMAMVKEMEKDGLLNTSGGYTIRGNSDGIYINNKKQPAAVYEKYKKHFKDGNHYIQKL